MLNEFGKGTSKNRNCSSSDYNVDILKLCDDNSDDYIDDGGEKCLICEKKGKDVIWYRCTNCGFWLHAECSGADTAKDYKCDICVSRSRK